MTFKFQSLTDIVNMTNLIAISLINEIMWYGFVDCIVLILRKKFLRIGGKVCPQLNQLIIIIIIIIIIVGETRETQIKISILCYVSRFMWGPYNNYPFNCSIQIWN